MKQTRFNILLKPIALLLLLTFLIHGCKIYDKRPVTIDTAVLKDKVKIITIDGRKLVYDNIYYKNDSLICGITRGKKIDTLESIIPKVQIKDYIYKTGPEGEINSFITVDGEKYIFDSFYYENDTLHGLSIKSKSSKIEFEIPTESIKAIYVYNKAKSKAGTIFISLGVIVVVVVVATGIAIGNQDGPLFWSYP